MISIPKWIQKEERENIYYSKLNRYRQKQIRKLLVDLITTKTTKFVRNDNRDFMLFDDTKKVELIVCHCDSQRTQRWLSCEKKILLFTNEFPKNVELLLAITHRSMCKKYDWKKDKPNG